MMGKSRDAEIHNEFSHIVTVSELPKTGVYLKLEATDEEREALAERYNIIAVKELFAQMRAEPWKGRGVHVSGTFNALVEQACIVSLDPLEEKISGDFSVYFQPDTMKDDVVDGEIVLDPESADELDMLQGDELDVGEVIAEQVAVALNPYPRKPGVDVSLYAPATGAGEKDEKPNPFAVLEQLKAKQKAEDEKN
ncbi:MAG: YceD family protein [Hyphomicrobiales bacterium]